MNRIVIIDDTPFWRDMTADVLRRSGYEVNTASDGFAGLRLLREENPHLVILDVEMPQMEGLAFLAEMRGHIEWKNTPVIMLTGDMQRDHILRAKNLGAVEYLLKARFSPKDLLDRVKSTLSANGTEAVAHPISTNSRVIVAPSSNMTPIRKKLVPVEAEATAIPSSSPPSPFRPSEDIIAPTSRPSAPFSDLRCLLTFEQSMARVQKAMSGRVLSGVIAEVIALTSSTRGDLSDLTKMIMRDPILAARVLQAANSASNTTLRGHVSTIQEAVRNMGCAAVRNIAISLGIWDAMPPAEPDGFNHIRCWQHSLAVATLCQLLAPAEASGKAYLIGLCHDLGEIFFRSHFGDEYRKVLAVQRATGGSQREIEHTMLGISHHQFAETIWKSLKLPDEIHAPVIEYLHAGPRARLANRHAALLKMADLYANGLLLATSEQSIIAPLSRVEVRAAIGKDQELLPDAAALRNEVFSLTAMLATLTPNEALQMTKVPYTAKEGRIWLARDASFSSFDPIQAAADSLAQVTAESRLPSHRELEACDSLIVLTRLTLAVFNPPRDTTQGAVTPVTWPIPLSQLANFVEAL